MTFSLNKYKSIALEASAGTGKTFQISMRVTAMLLSGTSPQDILCLTFTNKARDEMNERIIELINKFADNKADENEINLIKPIMEEYAKKIKKPFTDTFIQEQAVIVRQRLFSEFSDLNIKTIESFNNSILKMFPFEAELRPDFTICFETEENDIEKTASDNVIENLLSEQLWHDIIKNFCKALDIPSTTVIKYLETIAIFSANKYIELKNSMKQVVNATDIENKIKKALDIKKNIIQNALNLKNTFTIVSNNRAQSSINQLDTNDLNTIIKSTLIIKWDNHSYFKKYNFSNSQHDIHRTICENISTYLELKADIVISLSLFLGKLLHKEIEHIKREKNVLSFKDITERAYITLTKDNEYIDKDYLYFRLDGKINHLLIDEFQDTSMAQWMVLKPLAEEAMAGIGQKDKSGSFFYVGDPKQNIYRFRGGSSRLFHYILEQYQGKLTSETLDINYRSGSIVVETVNLIARAFHNMYQNILPIFNIDQKAFHKNGKGFVRIDNAELLNMDYKEYTLYAINQAVENGWDYKDIAVLLLTNNKGEEITEILQSNNIPVQLETSSKLISTNIYRIIMSLADFIISQNTFSYLEYAMSYPMAYNPSKLQSKEFIEKDKNFILSLIENNTGTIYEKLLYLIEALDLQSRFNNSPDLMQIIDTIAQYAPNERNIIQFTDTINNAASNKQSISASENNAVTVMTIHKSKGLQFPIVILPTLDKSIKVNASNDNKLILSNADDYENAFLTYIYTKSELTFIKDTNYLYERDKENNLMLQDACNALYVALTRAEYGFFAYLEKSSNSISSLIKSAIELPYYKGDIKPVSKKEKDVQEKYTNIQVDMFCETKYDFEKDETIDYAASITGSALHNSLVLLNHDDKTSVDRALSHTISTFGAYMKQEEIDTVKIYLNEIINNIFWQNMFKGKVYKERKCGIEGSLMSIDIYSIMEDKIILADYKTGEITENTLNRYKKQIDRYEYVLKKWYNMPIERKIFHFHENKVNIIDI